MIDFGLLVSSAYFHSHSLISILECFSFFLFLVKIKNKNRDFSSLLSHSTVVIFNAIIWHNIYFDFIEKGERRKGRERSCREKGKKKKKKKKERKMKSRREERNYICLINM